MQFYRINEFAHMIGVSKNTLRNWDEKGILKPHHKMPDGTRVYDESQVQKYFNGDYNGGEHRHLRVR